MLVKILDKCNIFNAIDIQIVQERIFPTLASIFVSFHFFFFFLKLNLLKLYLVSKMLFRFRKMLESRSHGKTRDSLENHQQVKVVSYGVAVFKSTLRI